VTDRLKAWLDEVNDSSMISRGETALLALRAVVELHLGRESTFGVQYTPQKERIVMCACCDREWPCSTIQAIEGVLK
jgi:hypothetical protein